MSKKINVLLVDDSAVVRQVLLAILSDTPDIHVMGAASDPIFAMDKLAKEWPDVIVLDVEMPRMDGITFLKKIMSERPLQEILVHLKEAPMEALIKSVDPESWFSRLMFTPLDVHLLRECEVPLHFVNKVAHARPRKILAAIDPFHQDGRYEGLNDRILSEANKLATRCDATLEVIYAYDLSSITAAEYGFGNGSMFFSSTLARQLYESQGAAFDALAERNGIAPDQRRMIMGDPAKVLASYAASHDIDVIVMGRVRYGSLDKLIGSTVEGLLYKMPCSLWVIAPQQMG